MREVTYRACPICASRLVELLHTQKFAAPVELRAASSYDVVACAKCGLVYADQQMSQAELDTVYEAHSKYGSAEHDVRADAHILASDIAPVDTPWDFERLQDVAKYIADAMPDKRIPILDVGCSNGSFLALLRTQGFQNSRGIDPSVQAVANARKFRGVDAVAGSFLDPALELGSFDLLTISHVLEHLTDVTGAVRRIYELLASDGRVYVEVPDAGRYAEYLVAPFHDFNTEHINHFSLDILHSLMAAHGFVEVRSGARLIASSPTDLYPVVYGIWKKSILLDARAEERDEALVSSVKQYVRKSTELMLAIEAKLEADLADFDQIFVWGAGQLTMKLLCGDVFASKHIDAIIDTSLAIQGMHIDSDVVASPDRVAEHPTFPIVIGSIHHQQSIVDFIQKSGFVNPIVTLLPASKRNR